jgi:hypothetical protein
MSAAYFIVLDREDPGFDTMVNGKFLSRDDKRLEKVAKSLGIRPLGEFISVSPEEARALMEDLGTDPDEFEGMELPEQTWYGAQEGLDWVRRVSEYLRANPSAVKNAEGVLADLEEYRSVLEQAKAVGAKWNLGVDF